MLKWHVLTISLLCRALLTTAESATPDGPLSFSQAREIILTENGNIKAAAFESEAARAGVSQAGALQNPAVGVALDKFGANEIEASVEQTIELGGKRGARTATANSELDAARNAGDLARLELEAEIVRRFIPIAAVSKKLSLLDSIILIEEATLEQIRKRVEAGASKKTDLVRAEIGIEQLKLERSEITRQNVQARKKFAALGGKQDAALMTVMGSIADDLVTPSLDDLRAALDKNPALMTDRIEQELLTAQQKQLRAEAAPDLSVSAGYVRNNAEGSNSPLLGASMNIPLFNANTAAQKQAGFQRQALGERREGRRRLLNAEAEEFHSRLAEIDTRFKALKTSTIPKAEQVYSMMLEYYDAGSVGFLDLTESQSEMLRLRMELLDAETERALILADLMQTTSLHIQIVK